jgi:hypothetical protein
VQVAAGETGGAWRLDLGFYRAQGSAPGVRRTHTEGKGRRRRVLAVRAAVVAGRAPLGPDGLRQACWLGQRRAEGRWVGPSGSAELDRNVFFLFLEIFSCVKINPEISR